jgi:PAS domain-containing protein
MVGFVVDITDRVRTQQALRQSEFRYRTVASMAPGFVFEHRMSEEGTPEPDWASEGIEGVFGCKYEEISGHGGWLGMSTGRLRLHARRDWRWERPRAARPRFTPCGAR